MDPLYVEDMIEKYFSRKITGISEDDSLFTQLTSNTNGLLVCREQAVKLIALISGITEDKAHLLVRNLRKCDAEAHSFGNEFVKLGVLNGYEESEVCKIWEFMYFKITIPFRL